MPSARTVHSAASVPLDTRPQPARPPSGRANPLGSLPTALERHAP